MARLLWLLGFVLGLVWTLSDVTSALTLKNYEAHVHRSRSKEVSSASSSELAALRRGEQRRHPATFDVRPSRSERKKLSQPKRDATEDQRRDILRDYKEKRARDLQQVEAKKQSLSLELRFLREDYQHDARSGNMKMDTSSLHRQGVIMEKLEKLEKEINRLSKKLTFEEEAAVVGQELSQRRRKSKSKSGTRTRNHKSKSKPRRSTKRKMDPSVRAALMSDW